MPATLPSSADHPAPTAPAEPTVAPSGAPAGTGHATPFARVLDRHQAPDGRSAGGSHDDRPGTSHDPATRPDGPRHAHGTVATGLVVPAQAPLATQTVPAIPAASPSTPAPAVDGAGTASDPTPGAAPVAATRPTDALPPPAKATTDDNGATSQQGGPPSVVDPSSGPPPPAPPTTAAILATVTVPADPTTTATTTATPAAPGDSPPTPAPDGTALLRLPTFPADHLAGPAPVPPAPAVPAEAPLAPAPSPGSAPGPDLQALSASFTRTLAQGNGDYSVSVSMHPPELGQVRALLSLRGDILQVVLTPHQDVGHDALATALPALRDQLASGGLHVDVSLGQPGTHAGEDRGSGTRPTASADREHDDPSPRPPAVPATTAGGPDARIHLVL